MRIPCDGEWAHARIWDPVILWFLSESPALVEDSDKIIAALTQQQHQRFAQIEKARGSSRPGIVIGFFSETPGYQRTQFDLRLG